MRRTLSVFLVLCAVALAGPASAQDKTRIRIGTTGTYPPFSFLDENNRFQGFEIEIATALCARLEARCEFIRQEWNDMIPALLARKFDAIAASMSITQERSRQVDFTRRYYQTPASFAVRKAANLRDVSPAAMKGRVVGGQSGTVHEYYLQALYAPAGATVKLYESLQEAQLELARGRLDAVLADKIGLGEWLKKTDQGKCCALSGEDVRDPAYIGDGVGIAVRKEDRELRERLNAAIDAILKDGTYKRINDKYFPFSVY